MPVFHSVFYEIVALLLIAAVFGAVAVRLGQSLCRAGHLDGARDPQAGATLSRPGRRREHLRRVKESMGLGRLYHPRLRALPDHGAHGGLGVQVSTRSRLKHREVSAGSGRARKALLLLQVNWATLPLFRPRDGLRAESIELQGVSYRDVGSSVRRGKRNGTVRKE